MAPKASAPEERPKKRDLIRWDENKDYLVLLAIQYHCNKNQVKIPWDDVGQEIAPFVTGNAVIQHLTKIRKKREEKGLPVPGGSGPKRKRTQASPDLEDVDGGGSDDSFGTSKPKKIQRRKSAAIKQESDAESDTSDFAKPMKKIAGIEKARPKRIQSTKGRSRELSVSTDHESDEEYSHAGEDEGSDQGFGDAGNDGAQAGTRGTNNSVASDSKDSKIVKLEVGRHTLRGLQVRIKREARQAQTLQQNQVTPDLKSEGDAHEMRLPQMDQLSQGVHEDTIVQQMQLGHLPHHDQLPHAYHGSANIQQMQLAHPQQLFHQNGFGNPLEAGFSGHYGATPVFHPDPYHLSSYSPSTGAVQAMSVMHHGRSSGSGGNQHPFGALPMAAIGQYGMQSQAYGPNQHPHPHHSPPDQYLMDHSDRPYVNSGTLNQQRTDSANRGLGFPDDDGEEDDNSMEDIEEHVPNLEEYEGI